MMESKELFYEFQLGGVSLVEAYKTILQRQGRDVSHAHKAIEKLLGQKFVSVLETVTDTETLNSLPKDWVLRNNVFPLKKDEYTLKVAMANPLDFDLISEIEIMSNSQVEAILAEGLDIEKLIQKNYGAATGKTVRKSLKAKISHSPVIKLVDEILEESIRTKSSDIHFEPSEKGMVVRLRQDGLLQIYKIISNKFQAEVSSRLKIMADLDIGEKRRPQDGRMHVETSLGAVDVRVSVLPTDHGEKLVLRLLDQSNVSLDLKLLGMSDAHHEVFSQYIHNPYGMVLVTGPTGSGKTTTLYSALKEIRSPALNISTVEDPIEYKLDGINQTQVKPEIGLDFSHALRSLLRQDPNVILVGEIRDLETAELAIRASLTGHLVFSTLHTNDAPGAIARLVDMGIEPFLVSSSLSLVIAQRLVRRNCPHCLVEYEPEAKILQSFDNARVQRSFSFPADSLFHKGKGCFECGNTGFQGRLGLYEIMPVSEGISSLMQTQVDTAKIREQATKEGMQSLRDDGLYKALQGLTTLEEVVRETLL